MTTLTIFLFYSTLRLQPGLLISWQLKVERCPELMTVFPLKLVDFYVTHAVPKKIKNWQFQRGSCSLNFAPASHGKTVIRTPFPSIFC